MKTRICRITGVLLLSFFAYGVNGAKSFATDLRATQKSTVTLSPNMNMQTFKMPTQSFIAVSLIEAQKLLPTITMYDSIFNMSLGVSNASYNLTTGELWAIVINDGKQYSYTTSNNISASYYSIQRAGFKTKGIKNTGSTPW